MALAHRIVHQGQLSLAPSPTVKTAYIVHGLLGNSRNWMTLSRQWSQQLPNWQFVLVDLPGHGESHHQLSPSRTTVTSCALDLMQTFNDTGLTPSALIGHSLGGKIVLAAVDEMAKQQQQVNLERELSVFALDTVPGPWNQKDNDNDPDSVLKIMDFITNVESPISSRKEVFQQCLDHGFSKDVANWMTSNIMYRKETDTFHWIFDIDIVKAIYESHVRTNKWQTLTNPPQNTHIHLVLGKQSSRWYDPEVQTALETAARYATNPQELEEFRCTPPGDSLNDCVEGKSSFHVVDSGHWIHVDNPNQLFSQVLYPWL